eukprot:4032928-Pleurochrysis_carterae.AAC.1
MAPGAGRASTALAARRASAEGTAEESRVVAMHDDADARQLVLCLIGGRHFPRGKRSTRFAVRAELLGGVRLSGWASGIAGQLEWGDTFNWTVPGGVASRIFGIGDADGSASLRLGILLKEGDGAAERRLGHLLLPLRGVCMATCRPRQLASRCTLLHTRWHASSLLSSAIRRRVAGW